MSLPVSTPVKTRGAALYSPRAAAYGSLPEAAYVARPVSHVRVSATYSPRSAVSTGLLSREEVFSSFLETTYGDYVHTTYTPRPWVKINRSSRATPRDHDNFIASAPQETNTANPIPVLEDEALQALIDSLESAQAVESIESLPELQEIPEIQVADTRRAAAPTRVAKKKAAKKTTQNSRSNRKKTPVAPAQYPLIGLIASKNPVGALVLTVQSLFAGGAAKVIVVDDGSDDEESLKIFDLAEAAGAKVIHLKKNLGKSKALKRGFRSLPKKCIIVQTDDDTLAGNLTGPAQLIRDGKADIVDIRVETTRTHSLLGMIQELDYWLVNAVSKRIQDVVRARLWMSGASVMYSYEAGVELILTEAQTMTEDTEGLFRARQKGWKVRYYSKHDGEFLTMVPEDWTSLHKQWKRWAIGSGQVIGLYGMGAGDPRIATVNIVTWLNQILVPIVVAVHYGVGPSLMWGSLWGILVSIVGSIRLKRLRVCWLGIFLPYVSIAWGFHAVQGLFLAYKRARAGTANTLTWVSPKRTVIETVPIQA